MTPGIPKNLVIVMKEKGTNRNNQNRLNRLSPERISKKSMTRIRLTGNRLLNATADRRLDKGGIVREAMGRWNESRSAVRGAQSGGETDTGDGDETVNRKN